MIWISPKQLFLVFKKQSQSIYVLFGNNLSLLRDTQLNFLKIIHALYYIETLHIELNMYSNWDKILNFCKTITLFSKKKVLLLHCSKDCSISFFNKIIPLLLSLIHNDLIIIVLIYTSYQPKKYTTWIQLWNKTAAVLVNCMISEHHQLEKWIQNQSQNMKLVIENLACQLLCYYYEGNHIVLKQILQYLSLVYPDGNLNFIRVKNIIHDTAFFNYNHWIESILTGKKKRANRVLKQLEYMNFHWKTLLYRIQREILIIIQIKHSLIRKQSLFFVLKKNQVYTQYHRLMLLRATHQFNLDQLHIIISLLVHLELKYHQNNMNLKRSHFEILTEIICNTNNTYLMHQFL